MLIEQGSFDEAIDASDALVGLATHHGFDSWSMIAMTNQAAGSGRPRSPRGRRRERVDPRRLAVDPDRALAGRRARDHHALLPHHRRGGADRGGRHRGRAAIGSSRRSPSARAPACGSTKRRRRAAGPPGARRCGHRSTGSRRPRSWRATRPAGPSSCGSPSISTSAVRPGGSGRARGRRGGVPARRRAGRPRARARTRPREPLP